MAGEYDLLVIGGGSGGLAHAQRAAEYGARAAVIEYGPLGGTCVNRGCVPKKFLMYASLAAEDLCNAVSLGWTCRDATLDWAELRDGVQAELRRLNGIYDGLLEKFNVRVYQDAARFLDARTLQVGNEQITADRIMIATGGSPFVPDFPGKEHVIVSDDVFLLEELPRSMAIVGGGYIAQEFASIFHGLGVKITRVVRSARLLRGFDAEAAVPETLETIRILKEKLDDLAHDVVEALTGDRQTQQDFYRSLQVLTSLPVSYIDEGDSLTIVVGTYNAVPILPLVSKVLVFSDGDIAESFEDEDLRPENFLQKMKRLETRHPVRSD